VFPALSATVAVPQLSQLAATMMRFPAVLALGKVTLFEEFPAEAETFWTSVKLRAWGTAKQKNRIEEKDRNKHLNTSRRMWILLDFAEEGRARAMTRTPVAYRAGTVCHASPARLAR
jgi:hypothetical protein